MEKSRKCWWLFDTSSDSGGAELSGIKLMAFDYLDRVDQLKDGRVGDSGLVWDPLLTFQYLDHYFVY